MEGTIPIFRRTGAYLDHYAVGGAYCPKFTDENVFPKILASGGGGGRTMLRPKNFASANRSFIILTKILVGNVNLPTIVSIYRPFSNFTDDFQKNG